MSSCQGRGTKAMPIDHSSESPPVTIPRGYVGEVVIPRTGRKLWWTGRVAIGLTYERQQFHRVQAQSERWIQNLVLTPEPFRAPARVTTRRRRRLVWPSPWRWTVGAMQWVMRWAVTEGTILVGNSRRAVMNIGRAIRLSRRASSAIMAQIAGSSWR